MKTCLALLAAVPLVIGACGGGGSGGGSGELKRVFVLPHVLEASGRISSTATADFNGDGIPDLVTLRESPTKASTGVTVQFSSGLRESPTKQSTGKTLARGAPAFHAGAARVFVWDTATEVCCADMDGDGCPDLIVAGGVAHQVGIWRCDPVFRDEFLAPTLIDTAGSADRVAVADVNGDGKLDLVAMDESTGAGTEMLQLNLFSFGGIPIPPVGACRGLVLADVDRDGRVDCVTNDPVGDRVLFLFGGAAGFTLRESPTKRSTGRAMAVGDTDGDGWLDVVVVSEDGRSVVCLHQRPAEPRVFDDVASSLPIAIDEPGVQVACIAIGDPGVNGNIVRTARERGSGQATGRRSHSAPNICFVQPGLGLADLDCDGRLDLVCSPPATLPIVDSSSVVVFGSPTTNGGFSSEFRRATAIGRLRRSDGSETSCACIEDMDGDGHLDVVSSDPDAATLTIDYFERGDVPTQPQFAERVRLTSPSSISDCATADLDRDGLLDCVTATTTGLEVRFQDAAKPGSFLAPLVLAQGQDCRAVAVGDVNGDGCPDLVVAAGANGGTFLRESPSKPRNFLPAVPFPTAPQGTRFRCLALGDLDADGALDIVAIRESPSKVYYGHSNNKSPSFFDVFTEVSLVISSPTSVETCDLDGDGDLDLAISGDGPDGSCIVLQDGHVTVLKMAAPTPLFLQRGVRVATGDVNGDGRVDVVTSGDDGVSVALQSTDVDGRFLPSFAISSEECGGLSVGDLDGDGRSDICFVEVKTGTPVRSTGDPDFDLLRVVSLNGLPPGVPVRGMIVVGSHTPIGDPDFDLLFCCPSTPGAVTGILSVSDCTK